MHADESSFPRHERPNGGYAQFLLTGVRTLIKLPKTLAPKDVAPYTDAGLTAYRAAKKASRHFCLANAPSSSAPAGSAISASRR